MDCLNGRVVVSGNTVAIAIGCQSGRLILLGFSDLITVTRGGRVEDLGPKPRI
jgi:hypothetical protein